MLDWSWLVGFFRRLFMPLNASEVSPMPLDWSPLVDIVRRHQRFLLTTHMRPDPDGLGSMLGLASVLEGMGKTAKTVITGVWPPRYDFMDPERRIGRIVLPADEYRDAEVAIVLDTGTWNQLGDFGTLLKSLRCEKIVIDHHISQDDLGGIRFADTSAEATGRLVCEVADALGQPLTPIAANHLFAAVATDTGWFRHANTTPATFALAEKLMRAGAKPTQLYELVYEQSTTPRVKLLGVALGRITVTHGGRTAYVEVRRGDYEATGSIPSDTEELVNYPRSITGTKTALVFMEQPAGGVKVSFRSRDPMNVAEIAAKFGGGGHRLAAGAILAGSLEEAKTRVLAAIEAAYT
jgi:bifunctional oligoribonuclease and PAP phosphatase NrnA